MTHNEEVTRLADALLQDIDVYVGRVRLRSNDTLESAAHLKIINRLRELRDAASPSAPAASSEDARDAARYRWFRDEASSAERQDLIFETGTFVDVYIDQARAAIAATPEAPK